MENIIEISKLGTQQMLFGEFDADLIPDFQCRILKNPAVLQGWPKSCDSRALTVPTDHPMHVTVVTEEPVMN